jgi:hypothetical protein
MPHRGQQHRLGQELVADVPTASAQCRAQTDLAATLENTDDRPVRDADRPTSRSVEDTGELIDLGLDIVTAVAHPTTRGLT